VQRNLPEIVFASADKAESQRISRWVRSGVLRRLVPRVYTSNNKDSDEAIVARNLYLILGKLFPGAVLSHRTALEGGPTETGDIFLTYKYSRKVNLPGFSVHLLKGPGPTEGDMPFLQELFMSSRPRAFLENLQISRSRSSMAKVLSRADIVPIVFRDDYLLALRALSRSNDPKPLRGDKPDKTCKRFKIVRYRLRNLCNTGYNNGDIQNSGTEKPCGTAVQFV